MLPIAERIDVLPGLVTNRTGARIVTLATSPGSERARNALVVLVPGYGARIQDFALAAWTFALNGFSTLRFDFTNHVGFSDGGIEDLTLARMAADVDAVLTHAARSAGGRPVLVAAVSLGARAAVRALSERRLADGLLC